MSSKHLRGDVNLAWPSAEIAVMGAEGAVEILYRREIASSSDPVKSKEKYEKEYREAFASPIIAAERGFIDDIIEPSKTRFKIIKSLITLSTKTDSNPARKHCNRPL